VGIGKDWANNLETLRKVRDRTGVEFYASVCAGSPSG
jgi:hypothetical protein